MVLYICISCLLLADHVVYLKLRQKQKKLEKSKMSDRDRIENELKTNLKRN